MNKIILVVVSYIIAMNFAFSQSGGTSINDTGNPADPSAILDVNSSSKGVLISRLTTIQRNAISNPAEGLLIFNTDTKCFECFIYGDWSTVSCPVLCTSPDAAGIINGDKNNVCAGESNINFNVGAIPNASGYIWILPSGATINTPSYYNTNSIYVDFSSNAASGDILVYGTNGPCNGVPSASFHITVDYPPGVSGTISGPSTVCQGQSVSYLIPSVPGATGYSWIYSGSDVIINGTTNPVTIDFLSTATSGTLTVAGISACGTGSASADFSITVNSGTLASVSIEGIPSGGPICSEISFTAAITNGGPSPIYQWQLNGTDVGTNDPVYTNSSLVNGDLITCILTTNICSPEVSNTIIAYIKPIATPGSGSTSSSFTAHWHPAIDATAYFLDVSEDANFSSFVSGYNNLNVGTDTFFVVTGLSALPPCGTDYYYRIRAQTACGTTNNSNQIKYHTSLGTITTGGTITNISGFTIHTFTTSGTFTSSCDRDVEVLVVAGGGGGAGRHGGGGGGGGVVYSANYAVAAGQPITVTIGNGGTSSSMNATDGENSLFDNLVAIGGGRGRTYGPGDASGDGGSGGGGSGGSPDAQYRGSGTPGQGNNGGNGSPSNESGGGGGGAATPGSNALLNIGGNGGAGLPFSISGTTIYYAGGGGGGGGSGYAGGSGGAGGGGHGGNLGGNSGLTSGVPNSGGGGGGCRSASGEFGGSGGTGIVIVRY